MQRTIIIGDVHGCFDELQALLKKVNYVNKEDRLIFVGDLINRGEKSLEVLRFVKNSNSLVVAGNHELAFLDFLNNNYHDYKYKNCFSELFKKMGDEASFWKDWIKKLPLYIEEEDFIIVHAGVAPNKHPKELSNRILTKIRTWDGIGDNLNNPDDTPWYYYYKGEKLIIYGHWATDGLRVRKNTIGLDSGCVWGGQLSALILPERRVEQVNALKAYVTKQ